MVALILDDNLQECCRALVDKLSIGQMEEAVQEQDLWQKYVWMDGWTDRGMYEWMADGMEGGSIVNTYVVHLLNYITHM